MQRYVEQITRFEKENNVKVVFASLIGSRMKGYNKAGSDVDLFVIYVPENPVLEYLTTPIKNSTLKAQYELVEISAYDLRTIEGYIGRGAVKVVDGIISREVVYDKANFKNLAESIYKLSSSRHTMTKTLVHTAENTLDECSSLVKKHLIALLHALRGVSLISGKDLVTVDELVKFATEDSIEFAEAGEALHALRNSYQNNIQVLGYTKRKEYEKITRQVLTLIERFAYNKNVPDDNKELVKRLVATYLISTFPIKPRAELENKQ